MSRVSHKIRRNVVTGQYRFPIYVYCISFGLTPAIILLETIFHIQLLIPLKDLSYVSVHIYRMNVKYRILW